MKPALQRTSKEIRLIYERQVNTVWRVCYSFLKNETDTEDAVQDTFLKLIHSGPTFESFDQEKAWLITTASNHCKNILKHWWRKNEDIDKQPPPISKDKADLGYVYEAVMDLDSKYRPIIYLHYYEGYTTDEIAGLMKLPPATVRTRLVRARNLLKRSIGDDNI